MVGSFSATAGCRDGKRVATPVMSISRRGAMQATGAQLKGSRQRIYVLGVAAGLLARRQAGAAASKNSRAEAARGFSAKVR
jgi:hypothetical protein